MLFIRSLHLLKRMQGVPILSVNTFRGDRRPIGEHFISGVLMGGGGGGGGGVRGGVLYPPNHNFEAKVLNFAVLSFGPRILSFSFKF